MAIDHKDATHIHKFAYVAGTDPGAVGAFKGWVDTSGQYPILKYRNPANTGWISVDNQRPRSELVSTTTWDINGDGTIDIYVPPVGKYLLVDRITIAATGDMTGRADGIEIWFTCGSTNVMTNLYGTSSVPINGFNNGTGFTSAGHIVSFVGRYDESSQEWGDFGMITTNLRVHASSITLGAPPLIIYVFGTEIPAPF